MVRKDYYSTREDGVKLFRSYSDEGVHIRKLGTTQTYSEAIDVENAPYKYVETDIPVDPPAEDAQEPSENETDSTPVQT